MKKVKLAEMLRGRATEAAQVEEKFKTTVQRAAHTLREAKKAWRAWVWRVGRPHNAPKEQTILIVE